MVYRRAVKVLSMKCGNMPKIDKRWHSDFEKCTTPQDNAGCVFDSYIPVFLLRSRMAATGPDPETKPHELLLWLPSQLSTQSHRRATTRIEWKLRHAQAYDPCPCSSASPNRAYLYKFRTASFVDKDQHSSTKCHRNITAKINVAHQSIEQRTQRLWPVTRAL